MKLLLAVALVFGGWFALTALVPFVGGPLLFAAIMIWNVFQVHGWLKSRNEGAR